MQNNIARSPYLQFHCPSDKFKRLFNTYVAVEDHEPLCKRIRLSTLPKPEECINSLVVDCSGHESWRTHQEYLLKECTASRKHHWTKSRQCVSRLAFARNIWETQSMQLMRNGQSVRHSGAQHSTVRSRSLTGVQHRTTTRFCLRNRSWHEKNYFLSTGPGSKLTEEATTASKVVETMCPMLEHYWVLRHGAPVAQSADDEYNRKDLRAFSHFTQLHLTPPHSKKKQDTNNWKKDTDSRRYNSEGGFRTHHIHSKRNCPESHFYVYHFFRDEHFEFLSTCRRLPAVTFEHFIHRSLVRVAGLAFTTGSLTTTAEALRARASTHGRAQIYTPGTIKRVSYASWKWNESNKWILEEVVQARQNFLKVRSMTNGQPARGRSMKPAYEHVRLALFSPLARELMSCSLETEFGFLGEEGTTWTKRFSILRTPTLCLQQILWRKIHRRVRYGHKKCNWFARILRRPPRGQNEHGHQQSSLHHFRPRVRYPEARVREDARFRRYLQSNRFSASQSQ